MIVLTENPVLESIEAILCAATFNRPYKKNEFISNFTILIERIKCEYPLNQEIAMNIRFIIISLGLTLWGSFMKTDNAPPFKLIVFEGSDWCEQCIAFEKYILRDTLFIKKLENWKIELEKIDFPQRKKLSKDIKKYNAAVADKYKFDGTYPTILLSRTDVFSYKKVPCPVFDTAVFLEEIEQVLKELNPSCHGD